MTLRCSICGTVIPYDEDPPECPDCGQEEWEEADQ